MLEQKTNGALSSGDWWKKHETYGVCSRIRCKGVNGPESIGNK